MTSIASTVQVGMKELFALLTTFDSSISVCIRGRHAVGKSEGVYQAAKMIFDDFYKDEINQKKYNHQYQDGLPVVERRLSQLTEGDITGIPDLSDINRKSTVYKLCDWLVDACERPVILFLDERNRALPGVKQAVFQLMDSKCFYGHKLHSGTRVIVAENIGDIYIVELCDPAEISRAATIELNPSVAEWLEYASVKCAPVIVDFIKNNEDCLEFNPQTKFINKNGQYENINKLYEPNKKYPDRRSWFKLSQQLVKSKLIDSPNNELFFIMSASMIGIEAAHRFVNFAREYSKIITIEDILSNWHDTEIKLRSFFPTKIVPDEIYVELTMKLQKFLENSTGLTDKEALELSKFLHSVPPEPRMVLWSTLQSSKHHLAKIHKHVIDLMIRTATRQNTSQKSTKG